jgi:hypothetical protein
MLTHGHCQPDLIKNPRKMKMINTTGERQFGIVGYLGTSTLSPSPPKRKKFLTA